MVETKQCRRCWRDKPVTEFHRHRGRFQSWCKKCKSEYSAAHYQANLKRRRAHNKRRQDEFRAWYTSLKERRPCADCGGIFHPAAMQWDHLPEFTKTDCLGSIVRRGSRRLVIEEIAKCELVCANCHAIRSYLRLDEIRLKPRGKMTS